MATIGISSTAPLPRIASSGGASSIICAQRMRQRSGQASGGQDHQSVLAILGNFS
jgi:hypothetical protein